MNAPAVQSLDAQTIETPNTCHYRVEIADGHTGCEKCGWDAMWTVVWTEANGEPCQIGTSWGDKEFAEDVCDLMNMAYEAGKEQS
jgi:hypothetical protein